MYILFMDTTNLLAKARALPAKESLEDHFDTIQELRSKNFTWREIADFLSKHGVPTDHSKVFRVWTKLSGRFEVPEAAQYVEALSDLKASGKLSESETAMLLFHYNAHNRSATYGQLAQALAASRGDDIAAATFHAANSAYGILGRKLGEALGMTFARSQARDADFFSSAIGVGRAEQRAGERYELVMHHELSKALRQLGWVKN